MSPPLCLGLNVHSSHKPGIQPQQTVWRLNSPQMENAPKLPSALASPSGEIMENSSVTLTCSSDANLATTFTWYKSNGNPNLHPRSKEPQLVFSSIQSSDSGDLTRIVKYPDGQKKRDQKEKTPFSHSASFGPGWSLAKEGRCSVQFSKNQGDPVYSNIRPAQPHRHDEGAEYAVVKFNGGNTSPSGKQQTVVQSQYGWGVTYTYTEICAFKGSTVYIYCTIKYPSTINGHDTTVEETFWFKGDKIMDLKIKSEYSGRVTYSCDKNRCTLRITDLRESDSAEYKFSFITNQPGGTYTGSPGVTLSVTDLQVQVSRLQGSSNWAELKCHSSCLPPGHHYYVWYKNGQNIGGQTSNSYSASFKPADSFSCAVGGYEKSRSPSVYAPKLPSVSVSPSAEIVEGSSVTLTCSSDANPAATYTWYKYHGNPNLHLPRKEPQLILSSILSSDSGKYYCAVENDLGMRTSGLVPINVKYAPKLPSVSVSPSAEIVEGSSVTLTCSSDANPAANYTWYKENQTLLSEEPQLVFSSIQSSDSGEYYCAAVNKIGKKTSGLVTINVKYAPKLPSVSVSPSAEIVEGSSVTLTCSSDAKPAANYTWYKDNSNLNHLHHPRKEPQLVFSSIQSSDSGEYYCAAVNKIGKKTSGLVTINVKYAPKLPSVSVSPSAEIVEGSSVTLTCSSDANPAANYTWYKENEDSPKASGQNFTITDFRAEHSGNYYCEAQNRRGHHNSILHLIVLAGNSTIVMNIIRLTLVVLMLIPLLLLNLWTRKKKTLSSTSEPNEPGETIELDSDPVYVSVSDFKSVTAAQTEDTEQQEDMV
ncbi:B-cell receptor CD22-like [Micropterus dolomieu]|uniref:B-cell receptor CD22-like n=1 Tax=Micropterus dolomieu TaxID=147949 RepID=UPI001E8CDE99|nr:B-cell receptor CD22-like [Micropterus dolomieu]